MKGRAEKPVSLTSVTTVALLSCPAFQSRTSSFVLHPFIFVSPPLMYSIVSEKRGKARINCFPQVSRALPMASLFESYQASICSMKSVPLLLERPCVQQSIKAGLGRTPGAPQSCQHPSILCTFLSSAVLSLKNQALLGPRVCSLCN